MLIQSKNHFEGSANARQHDQGYKSSVPAVEQAARVLLCLGMNLSPRMTLTEICGKVGIHKSKGFAILGTLRQFGLIEKDEQTKTYCLGPGLVFLARSVLENLDIRDVAKPFLEKMAKETQSTAVFGMINGEYIFVVAKYEGSGDIGVTIRLGHRFHITYGAHGKAIAAFLPNEKKEALLAGKKLFFGGTERKANMRQIRRELNHIKATGFAADAGELNPGISAVSAPVFGPSGEVIGCIILTGTFPDALIAHYGRMTAKAADDISAKLGADVKSK